METVTNWGDAVMVSATEALQNFLGFLPALVGAILILVIGWIIAGLLAGLVERVLKTVGFERAATTTGISSFIQRSGSSWTASAIVAEIVKWFIRLIAIQAAASVLGLDQISQIINAILLWLPNLVVAIAIIVIGALIARFVAGLVRGTTGQMGFTNSDILGSVAYYAILVFAAIAAVDQLGIAETVVNTLLVGLVAMVVLAAGLAFGLGGQQTAARITEGWYDSARQATRKVAEYTASQASGSVAGTPAATRPPTTPQTEPPITGGSGSTTGG
ncbi:MAG: mechanosensitive ion channel family protein [Candidatus Limnocylindria bacterium]